jgi:hypothetical protein
LGHGFQQELQLPPRQPAQDEPALLTVCPPSPLDRKAKADIFFFRSPLAQRGQNGLSLPITRNSNVSPQALHTKSNKGIGILFAIFFERII